MFWACAHWYGSKKPLWLRQIAQGLLWDFPEICLLAACVLARKAISKLWTSPPLCRIISVKVVSQIMWNTIICKDPKYKLLNSSHNNNDSVLLPSSQAILLRKEWQQTMHGISWQKSSRLVFVQWLQKLINIPRIRQRILLIYSVVLWIIHYIWPQAQLHEMGRVSKPL